MASEREGTGRMRVATEVCSPQMGRLRSQIPVFSSEKHHNLLFLYSLVKGGELQMCILC